jgi:hypothetical protein
VLLHCSADIGRSGGFIAVDAVLDGIRCKLAADQGESEDNSSSAVDSSESSDKHPTDADPAGAGAMRPPWKSTARARRRPRAMYGARQAARRWARTTRAGCRRARRWP